MSYAGRLNALYFNTGTYATPVWAYVDRISDVKRPSSRPKSTRKYRGLKSTKNVAGYKDHAINFKYEVKPVALSHAVFALMEESYEDEASLDLIMVNSKLILPAGNPLVGEDAVGIRGFFQVFKFDRDEADEDGTTYDVELAEVYEEVSGVVKEVEAFSLVINDPA